MKLNYQFLLAGFFLFCLTQHAIAESRVAILSEDFEGEKTYASYDYKPTGYLDGTQLSGTTSYVSFTGDRAFGNGNTSITRDPINNGYAKLTFKLPPPGEYTKRVLTFWIRFTVNQHLRVRVNLDKSIFYGDVSPKQTWDGSLNTQGWVKHEMPLPDDWGQELVFMLMGRTNLPQMYDPSLSNVYIDRITVTGEPIVESTMPPAKQLLTQSEAQALIASQCGEGNQCSQATSGYYECAKNTIEEAQRAGVLANSIAEGILSEINRFTTYCAGYLDGKSELEIVAQQAFEAGAASIDQEAIRKEGFDDGVASIDQEAIRKEAFDAGVASVPVESIKAESYQSGYDAGAASVQCPVNGGGSDKEKNKKVTICHNANGKGRTIEVSMKSLQSHINHGDTEGACSIEKAKDTKVKAKK